MAANDYYNQSNTPPPLRPDGLPAHPQYQSYIPSSSQAPASAAPSYHSNPPSIHPSGRPNEMSPVSPFDTPFDDRPYPTGRPGPPQPYESQSSFGQDSRYYGQGGGGRPQDSTGSFRDDIPLQNHPQVPPKDNFVTETDHVYDAPQNSSNLESARPMHRKSAGFGNVGKKSKWNIAWVCYILGTVQVAVFIAELVRNSQLQGTPIAIKPSFNPMIGPSPYVQINMGARYMPCMHKIKGIQGRSEPIQWPCPNTTDINVSDCSLQEFCGFGGSVQNPLYDGNLDAAPAPNQWYRFIIPMFLHAGLIHIGFNMLLQMTLGREMEVAIGSVRFLLVYVASGIFGFVLGGNFAAEGIASTGASGALFGVLALVLLDLLYSWKERQSPWKELAFIALDVIISFVLGLLPGLDNYSHIGGFLMGLVLGICILHSPNVLRKRIQEDEPPYTPVAAGFKAAGPGQYEGAMRFAKNPVGFFKERKPAWWAWWLIRAGCLVAVFVVFIVLLNNFYNINRGKCSWCKYLSCLNVNGWCELGNLQFTEVPKSAPGKRAILESWDAVAKRMAALNSV